MTEDEPFKLKAFGIFEGGGAKGLAHVGALRALEEKNVDFVGIAGTSAGAIVAALVGVGYRSHQMFNPHSDERIGVFDTDLHRFLFTLFANVNIIHRTLLFVSHPVICDFNFQRLFFLNTENELSGFCKISSTKLYLQVAKI